MIESLKQLLRKEVGAFCRSGTAKWKGAIAETVDEIRQQNWNAVFFGGTLRSLLLSRLYANQPGRPRDVDIVVSGANIEELRSSFSPFISRSTRFGGLQLKRLNWQFDVWPLQETYALKECRITPPYFYHLPFTTFFNVEAVAVEVCSKRGQPRRIFSGDDQFFTAIINRTIEVNREQNPFPELCVVRALVMAANLQWKVGPRLLTYLGNYGSTLSPTDFEAIQCKHYGKIQWSGLLFTQAMKEVMAALDQCETEAVELALPGQLTIWPETEVYQQRIQLRSVNARKAAKPRRRDTGGGAKRAARNSAPELFSRRN